MIFFLLFSYEVGILGIMFFNLGTTWNTCVIEAPPSVGILYTSAKNGSLVY